MSIQLTYTFDANLVPVDFVQCLEKYGLNKHRPETVSEFHAGRATLRLYRFVEYNEGRSSSSTMFKLGTKLSGGRMGLPSFLAMLEDQRSFPDECQGLGLLIICEDVLVNWNDHKKPSRDIAYAYWGGDILQEWLVGVRDIHANWDSYARLARLDWLV